MLRELAKWNKDHPAVTIAKRLQSRRLPKVVYVNGARIRKAKNIIKEFKQTNDIQSWQIAVLTSPHLSYEAGQDSILVIDSIGEAKYLHDNSILINALSDKKENFYFVSIDIEIVNKPQVKKLLRSLQKL